MIEDNLNNDTELRDHRQLGDEWLNWDGSQEITTSATVWLFIILTILAWAVAGVLAFLGYYLAVPRLEQFGYLWVKLAFMLIVLVGIMGFIWLGLLFLSVALNKSLVGPFQLKSMFKLLPIILWTGQFLKIPHDKLAHSFLRISNILVNSVNVPAAKALMILPRCLTRENVLAIKELCKNMGVQVFTVSGGTKARALIKEHQPKAIIGIACERDLLSGLMDIAGKIPIIAIPNTRPDGPCKNTQVEILEVKQALTKLLKINVNES
jgi:uncharacterized protein